MKSLIDLSTALLNDLGRFCSVETTRDLETLRSRAKYEGISFLTITLPDFASEFERALELGQVDSTRFVGWKKRGCLPAFLQGFTSLVFGPNGRLLYEPNISAVYSVRQLCRVFKKIRLECSEKRIRSTFQKYVDTETALPETIDLNICRYSHFLGTCDTIWSNVFGSEFSTFGLVPKHGPGATAERISGNAKYAHLSWNERLERDFPVTEHYFTSVNHMFCARHGLDRLTMVPESKELPVRVISVPKTLKAPRIIAIEPVCMQYTQQAVSRWIMTKIQSSDITKSSIRFNDQKTNQEMAISSSYDRSYSTIDLSDASDRVPLQMVRGMLSSCPDLVRAVEACRSRRAQLPDGRILNIKKFASMGSALCFPIESMYFFSIIIHAILWKHKQIPSLRSIINVARRVYVFGDDIIVPRDETDTVVEALQYYYCKVNTTKSFWNGQFRESCGADAYRGVNITPVYVREMRPSSRRTSSGVVSWIATSNLFHEAGCWQTADFMKNEIESLLGKLPVVADSSPGLGWNSFMGIPFDYRQCKNTHRPIVHTYKVRTISQRDPLQGYPALLKYFLRVENREIDSVLRPLTVDKRHLMTSARCGTVSRKRHWVPAS